MTRPATFDHLSKSNGKRRVVAVCLDDDATEALRAAEESGDKDAIAAAQAAVDDATVELRFASIGRKEWERLIDANPPTKDQVAKAIEAGEPKPEYDVEAFAVAAVAASCVEPSLTPDEVKAIYDTWNAPEFGELYTAALLVNSQSRIVPFRSGSAETRT